MRWALLDTNALFLPFTHRIALDEALSEVGEPVRLAVPESVLGELDRLIERGIPHAPAARRLAERYDVLPVGRRGDIGIVELAVASGGFVVTADRGLRTRLRNAGVTVFFPRAGGQLQRFPGAPVERRATVMNRTSLQPASRGRRRAAR